MIDNHINSYYGFDINSQEPIDSRLVLTKADMDQVGSSSDIDSKFHLGK